MTFTSTATPDGSPHDALTLRSTLDILAHDRRAFGGWLGTFDDVARAPDVARHSYWHPNGFAKLVLQACQGHTTRLHVWPAGSNHRGKSKPHGHRWEFASALLCGDGLRITRYAEAATGALYERYQYTGGNVAGALTHVRTVRLMERDTHVLRTGDRCVLDTSDVHTVQPLGTALIATLVVHGVPRLASTPVYGIPGVNVDEPGRAISAAEVRELIGDVLSAMPSS